MVAFEVEGMAVEGGGDLQAVVHHPHDEGMDVMTCRGEVKEWTRGKETEDGEEDLS